MPKATENLKLGKGAAFVKSRLRRLPQNDDVWEAGFGPLEEGVTWIGLVVCPASGAILASEFGESVPTVNDLAALVAHAMRRPAFGSVDAIRHSTSQCSGTTLAHQPNTLVSDFVTAPQNEADFSTGELSKLAHAWPRLPDHLRAAILLMVQPWASLGQPLPLVDKANDSVVEPQGRIGSHQPAEMPDQANARADQ